MLSNPETTNSWREEIHERACPRCLRTIEKTRVSMDEKLRAEAQMNAQSNHGKKVNGKRFAKEKKKQGGMTQWNDAYIIELFNNSNFKQLIDIFTSKEPGRVFQKSTLDILRSNLLNTIFPTNKYKMVQKLLQLIQGELSRLSILSIK